MRTALLVTLTVAMAGGAFLAVTRSEADDGCGRFADRPEPERGRLVAQCRAWNFTRVAEVVNRNEPQLIPNSQFASMQEWTLSLQGYSSRHTPEYKRLLIGPPASANRRWFENAYRRFAGDAHRIHAELPGHLATHRSMFTDAEHDRLYMEKYDRALATMRYDAATGTSRYQGHDCDYLAQPVNALWFSLNASLLIEDYAVLLWGTDWLATRQRILSEGGFRSPGEILAEVERPPAYSVVPHLAPRGEGGEPGPDPAPRGPGGSPGSGLLGIEPGE